MTEYDQIAMRMLPDPAVVDEDEPLQEAAEAIVDYWVETEPDLLNSRRAYGKKYDMYRVVAAVCARIEQARSRKGE